MKILSIALFNNPKGQGGIETFNRNLEKIFKKDIKIITWSYNYVSLYKITNLIEIGSSNFIFRLINKLLLNKLREVLLKIKVKRLKPQNIIFSYPNELVLLKNSKAKKILVQHVNASEYKKLYSLNEKTKKILQKELDYFILLSENDREVFKKILNIDEKKIKVIRHTCNIEVLKEKKEKNKTLIMIARIDNYQKRFDLAIKAMKKLGDFSLEIYGTGFDENYCKSFIQKENITNVFLKGRTNEVQEKLDKAGIFIMTSDYEGYGITNIEAMRRGLPIILRNTFEAAEDIVVNNENGVLLEKEWDEDKFVEAVKKVYANYEYYSENAKRLGKRYDKEIIKEEWDKLLNS